MTGKLIDPWRSLLPQDLQDRAYRASNSEPAWARADSMTVLHILLQQNYRILGLEVWLPTHPGPTITGYYWDETFPMSASTYVATFAWGRYDRLELQTEPYFAFTVEREPRS